MKENVEYSQSESKEKKVIDWLIKKSENRRYSEFSKARNTARLFREHKKAKSIYNWSLNNLFAYSAIPFLYGSNVKYNIAMLSVSDYYDHL